MPEPVYVYCKPYKQDYHQRHRRLPARKEGSLGKRDVRFGKMVVETRVCSLDCIVFGKVGGDVDVWRVWI